jgi:transcriptional regulator with XRE-family HTH domain
VEPKTRVGENIKARRAQLGITQEDAAQRCFLHPVEFARAERGTRDLRVSTIAKLAHGLDVDPGDLLAGVRWAPDE